MRGFAHELVALALSGDPAYCFDGVRISADGKRWSVRILGMHGEGDENNFTQDKRVYQIAGWERRGEIAGPVDRVSLREIGPDGKVITASGFVLGVENVRQGVEWRLPGEVTLRERVDGFFEKYY